MRRIVLGGLWLGFIVYAVALAPPDQPDTAALIGQLATGNWQGINPAIAALFNTMGLWPLIYACVVLVDGHGQPARAWPFVLGSFAVGAFAILPYLIWRRPSPDFVAPPSRLLQLLESRWLSGAILLGAIALLGFGLAAGDWPDFWQQWRTSRFIHVMSLDFCLLWALFPLLLGDDMARRQLKQPALVGLTLVPLVGAAAYLLLRPRLRLQAATGPLAGRLG
jgi:hypothetical protein